MTNPSPSLRSFSRASLTAVLVGLVALAGCSDIADSGDETDTPAASVEGDTSAVEHDDDATDSQVATSEAAATSVAPACVRYRRGGTALGGGAVFYVTNACPTTVKVKLDFVGTSDSPCWTIGAHRATSFTSTRVQATKRALLVRC